MRLDNRKHISRNLRRRHMRRDLLLAIAHELGHVLALREHAPERVPGAVDWRRGGEDIELALDVGVGLRCFSFSSFSLRSFSSFSLRSLRRRSR